jgi:hypothetical protein
LAAEVFVDDIKIVGPIMEKCDMVYRELAQHINIECKDPIKSFIGVDSICNWNQHLIAFNRGAYIDRVVSEFGLIDAHTVSTLLVK